MVVPVSQAHGSACLRAGRNYGRLVYWLRMSVESRFFESTSINDVLVITLLDTEKNPPTYQIGDTSLWELLLRDLCLFLASNRPAKVLLDFNGLSRIAEQNAVSSRMNNVYATAKKFSNSFGCEWRICGLIESCRRAYEMSSLHLVFPKIHSNQSEAIEAYSSI